MNKNLVLFSVFV